jgi:hypothetical protein
MGASEGEGQDMTTQGQFITPGTVVRFVPTGHADRVYHVRVADTPQHKFSSDHGDYIAFSGRRVRPADPSVSFGEQHSYTVRAAGIVKVR